MSAKGSTLYVNTLWQARRPRTVFPWHPCARTLFSRTHARIRTRCLNRSRPCTRTPALTPGPYIEIFKYNPLGWFHLQHSHIAIRRNCWLEFVIVLNLGTSKKNPKLNSHKRNVYKNAHTDILNLPGIHTRRVQRKWTINDKSPHELESLFTWRHVRHIGVPKQ